MTHTPFKALGLADALLAALARMDITQPTPIQAKAIPHAMKGRDILGIAQTGTGKTAAFALPVIHAILKEGGRPKPKSPKAVFLAPTRELASQIADSVKALTAGTPVRHHVIFGGVSIRPQIEAMRRGVDIVVATPGRLLDLIDQKVLQLDQVRHVVLDEADRMLDMGFVRDVMRIVRMLPDERQSLLFSATMPRSVEKLSAEILSDPVRVEVTPEVITVEAIDQSAFLVPQKAKKLWLIDRLADPKLEKVVIFTRTKHGANRLSGDLEKAGIEASAIHGNKSQAARQKALAAFHGGRMRVLVATDIVARGIHVDEISHVVNFDLPEEAESYVHRIGRTGRAGRSGIALTLVDPSERGKLRSIEKLTGRKLDLQATDYAAGADLGEEEQAARPPRANRSRRPGSKPDGRKAFAQKPAGADRSGHPQAQNGKAGDPKRPARPNRPRRQRNRAGGGARAVMA